VIPDSCAAGFIDFLKAIEPVTSAFDPATATFGDFFTADDAVSDKGVELLLANGGYATYSCSGVGLEFAYFDDSSPWAAIHQVAAANAPGTVAWLQTKEKVSALDVAQLTDYGESTCDSAVARIKQDVADGLAAGNETVDDLSVDEGLAVLGLYNAYIAQVGAGTCPRDQLGNDEFGYMGTH
jgi:hypothetical protein